MSSLSCFEPESIEEIRQAIQSSQSVAVVGNRTKTPLCGVWNRLTPDTIISVKKLQGVLQYEPSEFTFTAYAGTMLCDINAVLAERNQYLPFDPMLVQAGATIGGTVAAGLSGPGRLRYGGIRDFLLGVKLVLGNSDVVDVGGKVVKNAAGFDVPKFLIGSLGRFGAMVELTFKVFPNPPACETYCVEFDSVEKAAQAISFAATSRWELDAIDFVLDDMRLYLRQRGSVEVNRQIASHMHQHLGNLTPLDPSAASEFWSSVTELNWQSQDSLIVKIPTTPSDFPELCQCLQAIDGVSVRVSVAGSVAWVALQDVGILPDVSQCLEACNHHGLVCRGDFSGEGQQGYLNRHQSSLVDTSLQKAFDPERRFG